MTLLFVVAVGIAGGIGAVLRYLADNALPDRVRAHFPWGTAVVNLSGSFVLGMLTGAAGNWLSPEWLVVLGTGLLGGYTTFSTSSYETVELLRQRRNWAAVLNGLGLIAACTAVAILGLALTGS